MFYDNLFVLYCTANPSFCCKNPANVDDVTTLVAYPQYDAWFSELVPATGVSAKEFLYTY